MRVHADLALVLSLSFCTALTACEADRPNVDDARVIIAHSAPPPLGPCAGVSQRASIPLFPPARESEAFTGELSAWLNGAELPSDPVKPRPTVDDALRARGAAIFADRCAVCHGEKGDSKSSFTEHLVVPPRDFTSGVYALRSTEAQALPTDEDLFRTMTRGIHGTSMVPVQLPEEDRWALVAYLKTLSSAFADDEAPAPEAIPPPPARTPALLAHGREVYEQSGCRDCHGDTGHGDGQAAAQLKDPTGRLYHPRDFTAGRFWRSGSEQAIYQTLRTGLDGTPMASYAKLLSVEDSWAVAEYVFSLEPTFVAVPMQQQSQSLRCPTMASTDAEELLGARIANGLIAP